ncbi:DUF2867 domain-containing protein [Azohydromonas caseinilytica]|uniref:DUF2867 domain-containing protein n=1 Tax=Azohydromonas caseinilytica TaxID=2728836 RepID=A0A848FHV1_9BURK|nr:DUF2867 domain-containing protein [Azohydromonas caseinilytica]NML18435.1 DUF2867 domain-containing protein [Azohydromonas caseinilytica]
MAPNRPRATQTPLGSLIAGRLAGAYFHDAWSVRAGDQQLSALGQFLKMMSGTPRWIEHCMALRNRVVAKLGLKYLGGFSNFDRTKAEADYRPGDRVGLFTLFERTPDEVLLGDRDKHLDVVLSLYRQQSGPDVTLTVTTVVHVHNWLGRIYMLPVAPMHKVIAPATMRHLALP